MRQRAISTPPPICNSKGKTAFFVRTCTCPDPGTCVTYDIHGLTFPEAMGQLPDIDGTHGTWRYIDKEKHIDESGTWNKCPAGPTGWGVGFYYDCATGAQLMILHTTGTTLAAAKAYFQTQTVHNYCYCHWQSDDGSTSENFYFANCP